MNDQSNQAVSNLRERLQRQNRILYVVLNVATVAYILIRAIYSNDGFLLAAATGYLGLAVGGLLIQAHGLRMLGRSYKQTANTSRKTLTSEVRSSLWFRAIIFLGYWAAGTALVQTLRELLMR